MLLNDDIVDIKKTDGISSLTFVVDEFLGLFLHPSIFSVTHRFTICINIKWCLIRFLILNINFLDSSDSIITLQKCLFSHSYTVFYAIPIFFSVAKE